MVSFSASTLTIADSVSGPSQTNDTYRQEFFDKVLRILQDLALFGSTESAGQYLTATSASFVIDHPDRISDDGSKHPSHACWRSLVQDRCMGIRYTKYTQPFRQCRLSSMRRTPACSTTSATQRATAGPRQLACRAGQRSCLWRRYGDVQRARHLREYRWPRRADGYVAAICL